VIPSHSTLLVKRLVEQVPQVAQVHVLMMTSMPPSQWCAVKAAPQCKAAPHTWHTAAAAVEAATSVAVQESLKEADQADHRGGTAHLQQKPAISPA
jgi:hypothetical protein